MGQLMIFTETNIYILSKLVALVRRATGSRHRLNSEEAILKLLKESSRINDVRISGYYARFIENLSDDQLNHFKASGLAVPERLTEKSSLLQKRPSRQQVVGSGN